MIATPEVTLIAHTTIDENVLDVDHMDVGETRMGLDESAMSVDTLAEFAGRSCYQAWSKPNPATRANKDYLANIIRQQHTSVLEHASASFYITGVSRAFLAEITRHRHLSFSVQSQRFVDESEANIVVPPAIRDHAGKFVYDIHEGHGEVSGTATEALEDAALSASGTYEVLVDALTKSGLPRKRAREAARAVLPNMTEVRMVVTGNMRAWRDTLVRRLAPGADAEMREVADLICTELEAIAPHSMQGVRETAAADN